eukprot:Skav232328  [mRNA]  locus=scaffold2697:363096:363883:- [translate_table: standard]
MVLEDTELRSLRIPSTAHRGSLSPSKHSYLPTLQEQVARAERAHEGAHKRPQHKPDPVLPQKLQRCILSF